MTPPQTKPSASVPARASTNAAVRVGSGNFRYTPVIGWPQLPAGWSFVEVAGVATDAHDNVYVFNRGAHPMMVFDAAGHFLRSWGEGVFRRPHGVSIDASGAVWCADDMDHTVKKFTPDGKLLMTLGTSGRPSDTGAVGNDYRTIRRAAGPFNNPTNVAFAPDGSVYISDGYGNARVHKFTADGRHVLSWGEPGAGPGQFHLPHGIGVDGDGQVYVADRENSRIQRFAPDGRYVAEWPVARPCQVRLDAKGNVFVAEVGYHAGMWPGTSAPSADAPGGRIGVFDRSGKLCARWGGGLDPCAPGDFFAPHDVCIDSRGSVYVGEVVMSAGGNRGMVPPDCHALQKFEAVGSCQ